MKIETIFELFEKRNKFDLALRLFLSGVTYNKNNSDEIMAEFNFIDNFKVVACAREPIKYILFLRQDCGYSLKKGFYPQVYINRIDNKIDVRIRESYINKVICKAKDKILAFNKLGIREFDLDLFNIDYIDEISSRLIEDIMWFSRIPRYELEALV